MDRWIPKKEICEADATFQKGKRKRNKLLKTVLEAIKDKKNCISSGPEWNNCFTLGFSVLGDQILSIHVRTCFVI